MSKTTGVWHPIPPSVTALSDQAVENPTPCNQHVAEAHPQRPVRACKYILLAGGVDFPADAAVQHRRRAERDDLGGFDGCAAWLEAI